VDSSAIERLKRKASEHGLKNVHAVVGEAEETVFCSQCADIVFYSMVLHDFKDPVQVLLNAKKMVKSTGTFVDLDWKKKLMLYGPPFPIRFSEAKATGFITQAGFTLKSVKEAGRYHYIITAKP
jgi:ubiquinone/menaquinone biosynthesis C-methylase UbiE